MGQLVQKYMDISKVVIWGEQNESGKNPRLILSFRDGNPRFVVYTGNQGSDSVINFPSDVPTMVSILNTLKDVVKSEPGTQFSFDSLTNVYQDNRPTKEKRVVSTLYLGKSKEGYVYLSIISEGKPKLVFTIKKSDYHKFKDSNKNEISDAKVSEMLANGIADTFLNLISTVILQYTVEEYTDGIRKTVSTNNQNTTTAANNNTTQKENITVKIDDKQIAQDLDDLGL